MIEVLNLIGEDIEDRKISEVENIYNKVSEIKDELRNIVSPRVNEQKRCNIIAKNIIDYFEEWLPNYKIDLRKPDIVSTKFAFYFMMRKLAKKTFKEIGSHKAFEHNYDHSSVMHGVNTFLDMYETKDFFIHEIIEHAELVIQIPLKKIIKKELSNRKQNTLTNHLETV